jgi:hypothetical protein
MQTGVINKDKYLIILLSHLLDLYVILSSREDYSIGDTKTELSTSIVNRSLSHGEFLSPGQQEYDICLM